MEESSRLTAHEIFEEVEQNAQQEVRRPSHALAFSGLAGGITMGLTGLAVAAVKSALPESANPSVVPYLFYPLGFIAVIIGRAQLFTENTLYPVALVLSERRHFLDTARLWSIVFLSNVVGAACFAALAVKTGALNPAIAGHLVELGQEAVRGSGSLFWSGVVGGWLIALVAWMVSASQWTIGQIMVVWLLTFVVGVGHFSHCIASSGEILSAVFAGTVSMTSYLGWLAQATAGNIVGGIFIVTLLNFGQVKLGNSQ